MAEITASPTTPAGKVVNRRTSPALLRVVRYTAVRLATLALTVVVGLYLTILIANMGGYVDTIRKSQVREEVTARAADDPALRQLDQTLRQEKIAEEIRLQEKRLGLDTPFIVRSFTFLGDAITLDMGRALKMTSNSGSNSVRLIILERLPPTLILFASANILLFFSALFIALMLSRSYGSIFDKIFVAFTPLSSAPGWFYGIFLILIFASIFEVLPFSGMVASPPPSGKWEYFTSLLEHMILPVSAIALSQIFLSIFSWRTFFLIYSSEDYVEMARAKGLPEHYINSRYILRPTLPTIITSFALLVISLWTGAPVLESVFSWPGLGRAMYQAVSAFDTPVIVGVTVIFAYLLALTVFLLDFIYALIDPRVNIGGERGNPF